MSESSIFWTTGATGDGASPYTQAQLIDWLRRTFIHAPASEGVLKGYANELAASGAASPVAIATGAAMVYGFPYENTAVVNVAIPTPVIGTTGHRIVLRADWTAQTVRIALISSSDGVGSIPAAVQTPNTAWDVSLATLTITTGGVISLTDARGWAHINLKVTSDDIDDDAITNAKMANVAVGTAELIDDAVTNAKMANVAVGTAELIDNAVDDTKAGNRVPQFYRRQGGDASNWANSGASDYTPTAVRMQGGVQQLIFSSEASKTATITYPVAFSDHPLVYLTIIGNGAAVPVVVDSLTAISETAFTVQLKTADGTSISAAAVFSWLAIGPE